MGIAFGTKGNKNVAMCDARSSFGDMKRSSRIIYTCCNLVGDRF